MKNISRLFLKVMFYITYPVLIVLLIVVSILLFIRIRDINESLSIYDSIYAENGLEGVQSQNIVNAMKDLKEQTSSLISEVQNKADEITNLESKIETEKKQGYAEIKGDILPFVISGESFNQYQRVCAQSTTNENKQYCVTVSAIEGSYNLVVPEGEYYVFAELLKTDTNITRAYYTEYVTCIKSGDSQNCNTKLSENKVVVTVKSGDVVEDVNPSDWQQLQ